MLRSYKVPVTALLFLFQFLAKASCPIFTASSAAISEALSRLPAAEVIDQFDSKETLAQIIVAASDHVGKQRKGKKDQYCCFMPAAYPHADGVVCDVCPMPSLFAPGTDGEELGARIKLLADRWLLLEGGPREGALARLRRMGKAS